MKLTEEQRERISLSIYLHFDRFKLSTVDSFLDELEEILTEQRIIIEPTRLDLNLEELKKEWRLLNQHQKIIYIQPDPNQPDIMDLSDMD